MRLVLLVAALVCACAARAGEFSARVVTVIDGDTVVVLRGKQKLKVRLANIDAPEKDQPGGGASRQSLSELALHQEVRVSSRAVDAYGRVVGVIRVAETNVNDEQLRRGMAWEASHYHSNKRCLALQSDAQRARRGLWAQPSPVPPWRWRKQHAPGKQARLAPGIARDRTASPDARCGTKHRCSEMRSCAEARFFMEHCALSALDGDGDGVPCAALCAPK